MKRAIQAIALLLMLSMLSGCSIYVRPIVPEEHGTILDVIKPDPVQESEQPISKPEVKPDPETPVSEPETKPDPAPELIPEPPPESEPEESKEPAPADSLLKVRITPENPARDGYVKLNVEGPANTPYTAIFHFRTRDSAIQGYCGVPFQVLLGGATIGFEVKVDVTALIEGQVQKASASFTPQ